MLKQVEATAVAPVKERASRNISTLTNEELFALCKKHFKAYTFEEFSSFCEEAKPKWVKINTGARKTTKITFALDKKRAFFAKRDSFSETLIHLEQDIWQSFQIVDIV